jgi:hypothetical protein
MDYEVVNAMMPENHAQLHAPEKICWKKMMCLPCPDMSISYDQLSP